MTRLIVSSPSRRTRALVGAAVAACTCLLLTGCWSGQGASTTMQASMNSGNGTQATQGPIRVENATLVVDESGRASLIMSVFNNGSEVDSIVSATLGGLDAVIPAGPEGTTIPPGTFRAYGYGAEGQPPAGIVGVDGLSVPPSSYVDVTVNFERAGRLEMSVLTVPPVGIYEGLLG